MQPYSQSEAGRWEQFFPQKTWLRALILIIMFALALGVRLYRIDEPLAFHSTRPYLSAIISRAYYYETLEDIPAQQKQVAITYRQIQMREQPEPPVVSWLAVIAYWIVGGEHLWVASVLSIIYWLIGGGFVYALAREIMSGDAAIFSTAFYLFAPFGVRESTSFKPDPLMVMLMLASIYTIWRYHVHPSKRGLGIATAVSALAIFVKVVSAFAIFGAFISLALARDGIRRTLTSPGLYWFSVGSVLPATVYLIDGLFFTGFLAEQTGGRILPQLLLTPFFWRGWLRCVHRVAGFSAVVGGLIGVVILRDRLPRALLISLWASYVVFGLFFTYHYHSHAYYHLPMIPIVALSLGPVGAVVVNHLQKIGQRPPWHVAAYGVLALGLVLSVLSTINQMSDVPPADDEVSMYEEIGAAVDHSASAIFLAEHYGHALMYYGELAGVYWPSRADFRHQELSGLPVESADVRLDAMLREYSADYFIVTDLEEYEGQPDLQEYLSSEFRLSVENDDYLIFDLRE